VLSGFVYIAKSNSAPEREADAMSKLFSLDGKVALVTGASRGLGRAMSRALARHGAHVVINGRNAAGIEATCAAIRAEGGAATALPFDTTDRAAGDAAIDRIEAELGRLDVLVNNAGYGNGRTGRESTDAEWNEIVDIDLNACFRLARKASAGMIRRGWGRIINISSVNAHIAREANASYCAAKAGLEGMTRALAVEWGPMGITVNAIAPGYMMTPDNMETPLRADPSQRTRFAERTALKRWGQAEELDGAVVYLASDASAYCTGHVLVVDGGMTVKI
jgi:gluconate 5-dehydrogenase